jgi:hypothetical protein
MPKISLAEKASRVLTVRPSSHVKQRNEAIRNMNAALAAKLAIIEELLAATNKSSIMFNYDLGTALKEVRMKPNQFGGDGASALLEKALPGRADLLRRATQFAMEMTRNDAEELVALENTDAAYRLNWGHVIVLLTLKSKDSRLSFAKRAVKDLLDPAALHKLIQEKTGKKGGGGRPHKLPVTVQGQLREILKKTHDWVAKHETVWDGKDANAIQNILECAPDTVDVEMLENAKNTKQYLEQMATLAQQDVERFDAIIQRIESCLRSEI